MTGDTAPRMLDTAPTEPAVAAPILAVDDDPGILGLLTDGLPMFGYAWRGRPA